MWRIEKLDQRQDSYRMSNAISTGVRKGSNDEGKLIDNTDNKP